jgi:hypothetical protein
MKKKTVLNIITYAYRCKFFNIEFEHRYLYHKKLTYSGASRIVKRETGRNEIYILRVEAFGV